MQLIPETMDADGAYALGEKIKAYWRNKGYKAPNVFVKRAHSPSDSSARYDLRSDMTGGWPNG